MIFNLLYSNNYEISCKTLTEYQKKLNLKNQK